MLQIVLVVLGAHSAVVLVRFRPRHQLNYSMSYDVLLRFFESSFNFTLMLALVIDLAGIVQTWDDEGRRIVFAIAIKAGHRAHAFG